MYSNKQKFLPNSFSKCNCYHTLSSIHLKNVHEKKMQLTIFINKTNNKDVELIYGKYLNYITNYNCVNEPQPLNITIARNNKIIEKIMDLKNDEEKREILYFFKTTSIDIIKSILITYMKLKISLKDKKTVRKPNFFKNDNNEQKNQDGFCFNIFKEIKEEKYNNFNSLSQNFNEISQTILGDMTSIFHKSLDNKNLEDRQYFLRDIQNKIYLQSLYNEGIKETFILVVLAQVLEIIINEMEISLDQIKLILNKTNEILNYQPYLQEEISQNLKAYVLFTNEIFSKILDGEMGSCILLNNIYYNDSLIYSTRINPIIISLAFSIFKMKNMKKNQNDYVYSENNLPKATLILLEGYDHADNYRMVKNLKHLQIISIFIENDDLGISEEIEETLNEVEKTKTKKHFISIPLRNKNIDPKNFDEEIKSKDILTIFENIILPLISKYRPSFIIMTHSFTFCKTINPSNKISLNPKTLSIILYKLGLLSNQKIIVIPVVEVKKDDPFTNIELHKNLKNKKYLDFPNFLYERYHKFHLYKNCFAFENSEKLKSNRFYIYEMLGSCIHILSGNKSISNSPFFYFFARCLSKRFRKSKTIIFLK